MPLTTNIWPVPTSSKCLQYATADFDADGCRVQREIKYLGIAVGGVLGLVFVVFGVYRLVVHFCWKYRRCTADTTKNVVVKELSTEDSDNEGQKQGKEVGKEVAGRESEGPNTPWPTLDPAALENQGMEEGKTKTTG
ncbi:hypothetical protein EDC01DRAFT_634036 [Geopyxis carbonaria]|nr:hypothetical protein EDC01DRAFT_634036 [Geopyxis carbonaria]